MSGRRAPAPFADGDRLAADGVALAESAVAGGVSPTRELMRRFRRQIIPMIALAVLLLIMIAAVFAPLIAPRDPNAQTGPTYEGPTSTYLLGTDEVGRDVLSRIVYGARPALLSAFGVVAFALVLALPIGLVAGYFGGRIDGVLMRIADLIFTIPPLVLALVLVSILGASFVTVVVAIGIVFTPGFSRLVRAQVLAVREETFVEASRSLGVGAPRMLARHVLPNIASPLIVQVALGLGYALLSEAGLSFLGFGGVKAPDASWGQMMANAYNGGQVLVSQWPFVPPGVAILLTVLCFNLVGDGLRDALGRESFSEPSR